MVQRLDMGELLQKFAKELNVGITTIKDWRTNWKGIESYTVTIDGEKAFRIAKHI